MRVTLFHTIRPSLLDRNWIGFRQESQSAVKQTENVERLCEDVWLITEADRRMSVDHLISIARKYGIDCRIREFDLESEWQDHPAQG
jgi:hypothetical protein